MEGWKDGKIERWKDGRIEEWKDGRMERNKWKSELRGILNHRWKTKQSNKPQQSDGRKFRSEVVSFTAYLWYSWRNSKRVLAQKLPRSDRLFRCKTNIFYQFYQAGRGTPFSKLRTYHRSYQFSQALQPSINKPNVLDSNWFESRRL